MIYELLVDVFGDAIISGLEPTYMAILGACVFLILVWLIIKMFRAIGDLF